MDCKKTQLQWARNGAVTEEMRMVAEAERRTPEFILKGVAEGRIVVPSNHGHEALHPMGIGRELKTKINANIGTSSVSGCPGEELVKLEHAIRHGADTVMDLSTGENLEGVRRAILEHSSIPVGTVPVYELACRSGNELDIDFSEEAILSVIRDQAEQGVDYMTIHAGIRPQMLPMARNRKLRIVSRGGALIARYMSKTGRDNPFYDCLDKILEICVQHDVTLSLGDGMRPGCLADASDDAQFSELKELGRLAMRCREAGVQVMVEGPGHIPMHEIEWNMRKERELCGDAPFYVLGPVVMDCAPGYDHITSAIGAAMAAMHGAAMLCYVTPREHIGLPDAEDVRAGCIASKIAAHAADIAKGIPGARELDDDVSDARAAFDWERQFDLALDPDKARELRDECVARQAKPGDEAVGKRAFCSMCGPKFCSMRVSKEL